jgi:hypothetical protein
MSALSLQTIRSIRKFSTFILLPAYLLLLADCAYSPKGVTTKPFGIDSYEIKPKNRSQFIPQIRNQIRTEQAALQTLRDTIRETLLAQPEVFNEMPTVGFVALHPPEQSALDDSLFYASLQANSWFRPITWAQIKAAGNLSAPLDLLPQEIPGYLTELGKQLNIQGFLYEEDDSVPTRLHFALFSVSRHQNIADWHIPCPIDYWISSPVPEKTAVKFISLAPRHLDFPVITPQLYSNYQLAEQMLRTIEFHFPNDPQFQAIEETILTSVQRFLAEYQLMEAKATSPGCKKIDPLVITGAGLGIFAGVTWANTDNSHGDSIIGGIVVALLSIVFLAVGVVGGGFCGSSCVVIQQGRLAQGRLNATLNDMPEIAKQLNSLVRERVFE